MKIVLAALNAKYVHSNLAVYDLEAYAKVQLNREFAGEEGLPQIKICEYTINHNLNQILQALYQEKADVVAFSCYIWNISEILTVAKELKKVSPSLQIWLGGPEVSYQSRPLLEKNAFIQGIMQGEGEATFYELVKFWWKGTPVCQDIAGICYRNADQQLIQGKLRPLMSLDDIPFIYRDLSRFKNKILYYESSRGCPFSCSYCLSSIEKSVRFRSISLVEEELQYFLEHKVRQVKFIDRTFNCKKEHALAIWKYLLEHDNGVTNFHFEVSADLIDEDELKVFEKMRPGLIQLEIGLQSTNPETIREIRRVMDIPKLKQNMKRIRSYGNIHQHLDLIAGLPYEDFVTFIKSFNDAYAMKPNQLQLGFLKVLKGSYMGRQADAYELKHQEVQPYEVLSTKWLSYDEVLQLKKIEEMVEVYYNSDQFEHVLEYVTGLFDAPYSFYEALGNYYEEKEYFDIGMKREMRYHVLRQFYRKRFGDENLSLFDSLLSFDYYLRENVKNRPAWREKNPIDKQTYNQFFKNRGTDAYRLCLTEYDSKEAARRMHIEPVIGKALPYILKESEYRVCMEEEPVKEEEWYYCLYDYESRNPLTNDGMVVVLNSLV